VKGGGKAALVILLLCLSGLSSLASDPDPKRRHREEREPMRTSYYLDADRDGFGGDTVRYATKPPGEGWVTNHGDCDDRDPHVFSLKTDVVLDCDADSMADVAEPHSACVGKGSLFFWHDSQGYLHATFRYPDSRGFWWIDSVNAVQDDAKKIVIDPSPGCADR